MGDGVFTVSVPSSANAPPIFRLDGTADTLVFRELSTSPEHSPSTGGPSSPYLLITGTPTIERISQVAEIISRLRSKGWSRTGAG